MATKSEPMTIFLGQSACLVGAEMKRLCKSELGAPLASVFVDSSLEASVSVRLDEPMYLWTQSVSSSRNVDAVVDALMTLLETRDSSPSSVGILFDACGGLGSGLSSALIQELADLVPSMSMRSSMLLPTACATNGVGAINALLATQTALTMSECLIVRSFDDAMRLVTSEFPTSPALGDVYACIASDLLVAYGPTKIDKNSGSSSRSFATYEMWPCNTCSHTRGRNTVIDVRSSSWRDFSRSKNKQQSRKDSACNPLRSLSSNIHALHLESQSNPLAKRMRTELVVPNASLTSIVVDFQEKSLLLGSQECFFSKDVNVALEWAAPHVKWPASFGRKSSRDPITGVLKSSPNKSTLAATRAAERAAAGELQVAALSFVSPYGALAIETLASQARMLLDRKAYLHKFAAYGLTQQCIVDCYENVRELLL